MKLVTLNGPAVIGGVVRYPADGDILVSDTEGARLKDGGFLVPDAEDGLEKLKVDELKKLAAEETIDLGEAKTKPDIVAAIRTARAANLDSGAE